VSVSQPELPGPGTSSPTTILPDTSGLASERQGAQRLPTERSRARGVVHARAVRETIAVAAVGLFGGAVNAYYGPRGFMPLDHSVVFDGGWRTLVGQVPFRDYTTPNALTPSFLQALFFLVFGVTWKAYVLHATVFNALFAILVYVLLRLCGGRPLVAVLYACLSGLVFYPPLGVPFHDQHAFFFVLLAITLAVAARRVGPRASLVLWAIVPFALTAAALSKQTPTLLGIPIVLGLALAPKSSIRRALIGLVTGSIVSVALVVGAGLLARVDWQLVWVYFVELPVQTGESRGSRADATAMSLFVLAALFVVLVAGPSIIVSSLRGRRVRLPEGVALPLALSAAFMLMCGAFITMTLNEPTEGLPLFFASLGLFHIAVVRVIPDWPLAGRLSVASAVGALVATLAIVAGWSYDTLVNERRSASNIIYDEALVEDGLPSGLSSMRFQVPPEYDGLHAADIRRVVELLRTSPGSFVLVGDTTVLNGLTDTPSVFPALFLTDKLTIPGRGTHGLEDFERRLFERLEQEDVRRVVLERTTWQGVTLADLPRFSAWLQGCASARRTIGFFRIIELQDRPTCVKASAT
jgi:hypothetical protein